MGVVGFFSAVLRRVQVRLGCMRHNLRMPMLALLFCHPRWRWAVRWLACTVLGGWLALSTAGTWAAAATHAPLQTEVWIDPTGSANLTQAQRQTFVPVPGMLSLGYTRHASWWRVTVPPSHAPQLWLTVAPTFLDQIAFYQRPRLSAHRWGAWQVSHQGDQHAFTLRDSGALNYAFAVQPSDTEPTVVYLRVHTQSPHLVALRLQTPTELWQFDATMHWSMGLYVGMMLVMAVFAALHAVFHRNALWAMSMLYQLISAITALLYMGFLAKYVWPDQPMKVDRMVSVMACVQTTYGMLYYVWMARAFDAPSRFVRALWWLMLPLPLLLLAVLTGYVRQAMFANLVLLVLYVVISMVGVFWFRISDRLLHRLVVFTYLMLGGYLVVLVLPVLGWMPVTPLHLYPALLPSLFSAVMLFVVLKRHDWLQQRHTDRLLAQAREDAIRAGFHQRMQLDAEAANRTLRAANQKLTLLANTDPLTGAYNRRYFQDCITQELVRNERYGASMSLLVFDLDHFKSINDRYGHPVGDVVLVQTCQLLRGYLRASDQLARWGGEEFAVLLPHCNADTAGALAEKLRTVLAQHTFPEVGHVTASFGVAQHHPPESIEHWIGRADTALYQAKQGGRNTVRQAVAD